MKSVVICGSRKFKQEIRQFCDELRALGVDVYEPSVNVNHAQWESLSDEYKSCVALGLTHDHMQKIRMADVVFIYNKEGYSGVSTSMELGFALALSKPIYALHTDEEICRNILFRDVVTSPQALAERLK